MKVAVIKLGSRISFNARDTSGGNGEARSIINMLHKGGAEVHIFTKILAKDDLRSEYHWHNIADEYLSLVGYDHLVVLNGSVNFFGGAEDMEQLLNYCMINDFPGKVTYIFCDPSLTLKQIWPAVEKKPWGNKWSEKQLNITRKDITYLSQPFDVDKVKGKLKGNEIIPSNIVHFPFEQFPCMNESIPFNNDPEVHLSYGGTMRGGKRQKKMAKFYFGQPDFINVEMFGKISAEDFDEKHIANLKHPNFTGPVKYDEMLSKMNKAMAHVVIGDPWYEQINDIPQRLYESIMAGVVTFVDSDMDQVRRVFSNLAPDLQDFIYVNSKEDLASKLEYLIAYPNFRKQIHELQVAAINFDADKYCKSFITALKEV
jgi:hypothetical protein